MKNKKLRLLMMEYELTQYDLSKLMGVSEMTVYRKLRDELPEEEQTQIMELIKQTRGDQDEQ